jgi:hypothetical protein
MKRVGSVLAKALALFVVLLIGQVAGSLLVFHGAPTPASPDTGPLDTNQALLVANAADAIILALLASAMRARGSRLGLLLAGVLFMVQTGQSMIEAAVFSSDVHMSTALLLGVTAAGLVRDALAGAAIAGLWRGQSEPDLKLSGLLWKAPLIAAFYIPVYFAAGAVFAWSHPEVRAYYAHVAAFDQRLPLIQFGRGLIWCALAAFPARSLKGPAWGAALFVGLIFAGFTLPQLLFPNPIMPWPVRQAHMVETGISNFLFGAIITLLLRMGAKERLTAK